MRRVSLAAAVVAALAVSALSVAPLSIADVARAGTPIPAEEPMPGPTEPLSVETTTGVYPFEVEVADDPSEMSVGLMYRRVLPDDRGMLFDRGGRSVASFWMKNTFVSLDIIFIGPDGRVDSIAERTTPLSEAVLSSQGAAPFVLELVAGSARRIGLKPGDRIRHPRIDALAGG